MSLLKKTDSSSNLSKNRRKLFFIVLIGSILAAILFIFYLSRGQFGNLSFQETISALIYYIQNPSAKDNPVAVVMGIERLPRALAVFVVGIGLSISGALYQSIIRNPLVDPYIMGVSAGAGTAAVAVIAFNFTFFGLFAPDSVFAIPIAAMIGGLGAFFATMILAERSGGSSVNYVLAGVVIGLALTAVQTILLQTAGEDLPKALTWLFGSFKDLSWQEVWLMVIPISLLSILALTQARKLNLMLLGSDQAKQMGLDAKNFGRLALILASVIASLCVSFVGIIGFVGLVVPHICRMMFGGDNRFVLPASIILGGSLMLVADLIAKMALSGSELPVGAITTMIGVPVFAYLLIKRGRMYDG